MAQTTNANKADAGTNVGSKVIFENDKVRVWNFELKPGEQTEVHTHDHSYIWYAIQGGSLDAADENGNDLGVIDIPTGAVFDIRHNGNELEVMSSPNKGMKFPLTHTARNNGTETYREVLIEFKE